MIAFVLFVIAFSNSQKSICKSSVLQGTTFNVAPACSANTLYSGKNGANAITSSPEFTSAFNDIVSEAAAPQYH